MAKKVGLKGSTVTPTMAAQKPALGTRSIEAGVYHTRQDSRYNPWKDAPETVWHITTRCKIQTWWSELWARCSGRSRDRASISESGFGEWAWVHVKWEKLVFCFRKRDDWTLIQLVWVFEPCRIRVFFSELWVSVCLLALPEMENAVWI